MKRLVLGVLLGAVVGCAGTAPPRDDALFRQLGGLQGIAAIVEETIVRLVENPRIGHHFVAIDLINLHDRLVEQFCVEAGGPCEYTGLSMQDAHIGLSLDEADFNALVEDLIDAMEALDVPTTAQNRLLRRLAPMRPDVINR